jgi:glycosyltransferase involved in cell wall biosynthesis
MTISIVIPCYNEEKYVGKLLEDLSRQTLKPTSVFVVDCDSGDKTTEIVQRFLKQLPLQLFRSTYRSAAAARNTGANASKTDYLLFLDAD